MDETEPRVEIRENGPLVVQNLTGMSAPNGSALECKPVMALCRCGLSRNKPFCDGSHSREGFTAEPQDADAAGKVYTYEGKALTVRWNSLACCHAAACVATSKDAFDPARKPWIDADQPQEILKAACAACPSGALSWGKTQEHGVGEGAALYITETGPYELRNVALAADVTWPEASSRDKYVLCRCGASKNKPFCDGSHADHDWDPSLA